MEALGLGKKVVNPYSFSLLGGAEVLAIIIYKTLKGPA